jgi:Flp pilus assembly protein TadG
MRALTSAIRRHLSERTRGQSLVEFALILPVFLLLFGATLDLGRIAAARIAVEGAAREGAFQAAEPGATYQSSHPWLTTNPWDPTTNPCDATNDSVTCRALLESRAGSVVSISPADIQMTCDPTPCASGMGNTATVRVSGRFTLLTPVMRVLFGGAQTVAFSADSTTQVETLPTPAPTAGPAAEPTPTPTPAPTAAPTDTPAPTTSCPTPSAGFTWTQSGGGPHNDKAPVTITVTDTSTTAPACPISSWFWTFGDGASSGSRTPGSHTYVARGNYDITLTVVSAGGNNTSGTVTITVKP